MKYSEELINNNITDIEIATILSQICNYIKKISIALLYNKERLIFSDKPFQQIINKLFLKNCKHTTINTV